MTVDVAIKMAVVQRIPHDVKVSNLLKKISPYLKFFGAEDDRTNDANGDRPVDKRLITSGMLMPLMTMAGRDRTNVHQ